MYKKRRFIKNLVTLLFIIIIFSTFGCSSKQQASMPTTIPTFTQDVFIYDQTNVINDNVEDAQGFTLKRLYEKTGIQVFIVSCDNLLETTLIEYSNKVFNSIPTTNYDTDSKILISFSQIDQKVCMLVSKSLQKDLFDKSKCSKILDNYFVPSLKEDECSQAIEETIPVILTVISEKYELDTLKPKFEEQPDLGKNNSSFFSNLILGIVMISGLAFILYVYALNKK